MGLTNILQTANSGLNVTQSSIEVVARNIANSGTEGYTRKVTTQENILSGDQGIGVTISGVRREVDEYVQQQLYLEISNLSYDQEIASYLSRLDQVFGSPGGVDALDTRINQFAQSLQDLSAQPESQAARSAVIGQADGLASEIRYLSENVQGLRQLAEDSIADGINDLNNLLQGLEKVNIQIANANSLGSNSADLLDQRDLLISKVSEYLQVTVNEDAQGRASLYTSSGIVLVDSQAVEFTFDQNGSLNANSAYNSDPALRGVGTISLEGANGYSIDLIENGMLETGKLGAFIELRDTVLPQAQRQLDDLAAGLALTFSNYDVAGTAATAGAATGFDLDISNVQRGNVISLQYTDNTGPTTHNISIVRVDDPSVLPLSNDATYNTGDVVIGVDFSAGEAAVAAALDAALGADITVSNPSAGVLRIVDDGAPNNSDINSLSANVTATSLQGEGLGLPLFIDTGNNKPYSGAVDGGYTETGFAGRIVVNGGIIGDPTLLVQSSSSTYIGDNSRPLDMIDRLTTNVVQFGPDTGIGGPAAPYKGSVVDFAQNIITFQANQSQQANVNLTAQEAVTNSLQDKFESEAGVNIDEELSQLIALQQAYSANARVMSVTSELMDLLLQTI